MAERKTSISKKAGSKPKGVNAVFVDSYSEKQPSVDRMELAVVKPADAARRTRKPSLAGLSFSENDMFEYKVQPNETLSSIAASNASTVSEICVINRLHSSSFLFPGQTIFLPKKCHPVADPAPKPRHKSSNQSDNSNSSGGNHGNNGDGNHSDGNHSDGNNNKNDEKGADWIVEQVLRSEYKPSSVQRTRKVNTAVVASGNQIALSKTSKKRSLELLVMPETNVLSNEGIHDDNGIQGNEMAKDEDEIADIEEKENAMPDLTTIFTKKSSGAKNSRQRSISTVVTPVTGNLEFKKALNSIKLAASTLEEEKVRPEVKDQRSTSRSTTRMRSASTVVSPTSNRLEIPSLDNKRFRKTSIFGILSRQDVNKLGSSMGLRKPQPPFALPVYLRMKDQDPKRGCLDLIQASFRFETEGIVGREGYVYIHVAFKEISSIEINDDVWKASLLPDDKEEFSSLKFVSESEEIFEFLFNSKNFTEINEYLTSYYPHLYIKECKILYKPLIVYKMKIKLKEALNVASEDDDPINTFVTFKINGRPVYKSRIVSKTTNPRWEESFDLDPVTSDDVLRVKIKMAEVIKSKCVGAADLDVGAFETDGWTKLPLDFPQEDAEKREVGEQEEGERRTTQLLLEYQLTQKTDKVPDLLAFVPEFNGNSEILNDSHIKKFCEHLPNDLSAATSWDLVYGTSQHGSSIHTMYRQMADLEGDFPVLLAVQDLSGTIFGAFLSSKLQVDEHYYGNGRCFLYTFDQKFKKYEWSSENSYFIKGNNISLSVGHGSGGFGLWFDESFIRGSTHQCQTFNNDPLTNPKDFFVQHLEMWTPNFAI